METADRGMPVAVGRNRLWLLVAGAILLVLALGVALILGDSRDPDELLQRAR